MRPLPLISKITGARPATYWLSDGRVVGLRSIVAVIDTFSSTPPFTSVQAPPLAAFQASKAVVKVASPPPTIGEPMKALPALAKVVLREPASVQLL